MLPLRRKVLHFSVEHVERGLAAGRCALAELVEARMEGH
jgi:hypothetical protein